MLSARSWLYRGLMVISLGVAGVSGVNAGENPQQPPTSWQQICPGGGGRFMYPAFDPGDSNVVFSASDMGTCYRSTDAGVRWQVYPWHQLNAIAGTGINGRGSWSFDPHTAGVVWVGTSTGFFRSNDHGQTWALQEGLWHKEGTPSAYGPSLVAFAASAPGQMAISFNSYRAESGAKVCITRNGGQQWQTAADLPTAKDDRIRALYFDPRDPGTLLVITQQAVLRTRNGGTSWLKLGNGLPQNQGRPGIYDASGGFDGTTWTLYLTAASVPSADGVATPGVYRSIDGGDHWSAVEGHGLANRMVGDKVPSYQLIQVAPSDPRRVYVSLAGPRPDGDDLNAPGYANIYRSDDGGIHWRPVLFQNPKMASFNIANETWTTGQWGWAERAAGLAVDPHRPDRLLVATITGLFYSDNGGDSWRALHSAAMETSGVHGGGMPIMSTWAYTFDPLVPTRHLIAMTDFAGFVSQDAGQTWQRRSEGNPWQSNIYNIAFDPKVRGRMWAAASAMHDIPFYSYRNKMHEATGGVVRSDDGGQNWVVAAESKSLPSAAMTDIVLVPGQNDQHDQMFVTALGKGVYASIDGGKTWSPRNAGFNKANLSILRIRYDGRGRLWAISTINMKNVSQPVGGAVYYSDDLAATWHQAFASAEAMYPVNIAIDPHQPNHLALAVFDQNPKDGSGGVWQTLDGGKSWQKFLAGGTWGVAFSPNRPGRIYAGTVGQGLKISDDSGASWWTDMSFPFWRPTGVYFDPTQPESTYVTTFGGGVWRINETSINRPTVATRTSAAESPPYPNVLLEIPSAKARVFLPDAQKGFYRSTRFDWSGLVEHVEAANHRYFSVFHPQQDPLVDDAVCGPADEFGIEDPPGYADAKVGETFLKIGVGHLVRSSEAPYWPRRKFVLADGGSWNVTRPSPAEIVFEQRLPTRRGFGYRYVKTVQLLAAGPSLIVRHDLENTGERDIDTRVYSHNFVQIDQEPAGPSYQIDFTFPPAFAGREVFRKQAYLDGQSLRITEDLKQDYAAALYAPLVGFEPDAVSANRFIIRQQRTGGILTITGDHPLESLVVYGQASALCVEPFTAIKISPGQHMSWTTRYEFGARE